MNRTLLVPTEQDMEALGANASRALIGGMVIFLRGDLGTGKTTWVRGLLRGLGHTGSVKSPTYTLLEPYNFGQLNVYHFDLYRLNDPRELEGLGFREYLGADGVCCIEWPEHAGPLLPQPDCELMIDHDEAGRRMTAHHHTAAGGRLCENL